MMALDMTIQLAPIAWGMIGLLLASTAGIVAAALPRIDTARRTRGPVSALATAPAAA